LSKLSCWPKSVVVNNYIGTDVTGVTALGNANEGVHINGGSQNYIGAAMVDKIPSNVISGNGNGMAVVKGINVVGSSTYDIVMGNYIGVGKDGKTGIANSGSGIAIDGTCNNVTIGGVIAGAGNVISDNSGWGVLLQGNDDLIQYNIIGYTADGLTLLANALGGLDDVGTGNSWKNQGNKIQP
jgi:hypothetical protein